MNNQPSVVSHIVMTDVGATFSNGVPYEELERVMPELAVVSRASRWAMGDILVYTEQHYGDKYSQMMAASGLSYGSLANLVSTCARVPHWVRRPLLGLSYHTTVSKFPPEEQDEWLRLVEVNDWTRDELREAIALPEPKGSQTTFTLKEAARGIVAAYDAGDKEALRQWISKLRNLLS